MSKTIKSAVAVSLFFPALTFASSYITGNLQFNSNNDDWAAAPVTSTLEAGHTFSNGFTILTEFDGLLIAEPNDSTDAESYSPGITLGFEQSFPMGEDLWFGAGYQYLMYDGKTTQHRPLVKVGYQATENLNLYSRVRLHLDDDWSYLQTRFEFAPSYKINDDLMFKYNFILHANDSSLDADDTLDHEFRLTWTRTGAQPYVEFRNQGNNENNVVVVGASYNF